MHSGQRFDLEEPQSQRSFGSDTGIVVGALFAIFFCTNIAFIVPDLIYAYQGTTCVSTSVQGISFTLKTWLEVDAYGRVAMIGLFIIAAICLCACQAGLGCAVGGACVMVIYSIFSLAWTIVGSVLFWGKVNPTGVCSGGVHDYMYAVLIINLLFTCSNCVFYTKTGQQNQR